MRKWGAIFGVVVLVLVAVSAVAEWQPNDTINFTNTYTWTSPYNGTLARILIDPQYTNEVTITVDHLMASGSVTNENVASNTVEHSECIDSGEIIYHIENGDTLIFEPSIKATATNNRAVVMIKDRQF